MRYCPKCETLGFVADEMVCGECGGVTLALDDLPEDERSTQVVLTECASIYEAMLLRAKLADESIPAVVEDEELFQCAPGGHVNASFRVIIRLGDAAEALNILRLVKSGEFALSDGEPPEGIPCEDDTEDDRSLDNPPEPPGEYKFE